MFSESLNSFQNYELQIFFLGGGGQKTQTNKNTAVLVWIACAEDKVHGCLKYTFADFLVGREVFQEKEEEKTTGIKKE